MQIISEGNSMENIVILQPSSLEDYTWPKEDPHSIAQPTRPMIDLDLDLVRSCLKSAEINLDEFINNVRQEKLSDEDIILKILTHKKFQMSPVKEVRSEPKWKECVKYAMDRNKPIEIVYPQFCVIPNAPKRYTNMGPAAGEDCTIEFFKFINNFVRHFYSPGLHFHILSDASLYASAFQTHQIEVDAYYEGVQDRIKTLDASDCISLYDYAELLRKKCPEYLQYYYTIGSKVWGGSLENFLPAKEIPTLRRSVRCSVNTRRFQLTHEDHLSLFGPLQMRNSEHPFYELIEKMTDIALREVCTIRLACGAVDISSRLWPNALRASCHKEKKSGRWPIGLKVYPEYFGSCKLLPYHSMPIIHRDEKGKIKLEIFPEVLLRGRIDLVRITNKDDYNEVYAYVEQKIDEDIDGKMDYTYTTGMRFHMFRALQ